MPELEHPTWSGSGGVADAAWRTVVLGGIHLPGLCSVTSMKAGIDVDTKKAKGSDGVTSKDNGVKPSQFSIEIQLTERDWPAWLAVLPKIHPRRIGRERMPVEIRHPEPNVLGIQYVRILEIYGSPPTAKGGKKYRIEVEEWFDAPKPVKKPANGKEVPGHIKAEKYTGDPKELAAQMAQFGPVAASPAAASTGFTPLHPDDPANIAANLFP